MNRIHLCDGATRVRRTEPEVFDRFLQQWGPRTRRKSVRERAPNTAPPLQEPTPLAAGLGATLGGELERIRAYYAEPHRQDLVMGVTAYGLVALGLPSQKVKELVTRFIATADNEEHKRREQALQGTIAKHESGQRVAWLEFYGRAGVPVPSASGPSAEVLVELDKADTLLGTRTWRGQAGLTDRSVYAALLQSARRHGVMHGEGVGVSISRRELAERSAVSTTTLNNALKRLEADSLIARDVSRKSPYGHSGVLVIVTQGVSTVAHSFSAPTGGQKEWDYLYTHPAFMRGCLGKSAAHLLIALLSSEGPMTKGELARSIGRKSRDIRQPLAKLIGHAVLAEVSARLVPAPDFRAALEKAAQNTGAIRRLQAQKAYHELEREHFEEFRERSLIKRWPREPLPARGSVLDKDA